MLLAVHYINALGQTVERCGIGAQQLSAYAVHVIVGAHNQRLVAQQTHYLGGLVLHSVDGYTEGVSCRSIGGSGLVLILKPCPETFYLGVFSDVIHVSAAEDIGIGGNYILVDVVLKIDISAAEGHLAAFAVGITVGVVVVAVGSGCYLFGERLLVKRHTVYDVILVDGALIIG